MRVKILAIGGTGKVGSAVVKELVQRNAQVRVLVRNTKAAARLPQGVEIAEGDLLDPPAVDKALEGVEKLYLLNAVVPDELTQGLIAYDLARKRKIRHIVYHSVFRAEHFHDVPHFASKASIEAAIKQFDIPYTIIRPNYFFQNDEALKDALLNVGLYPVPLGPTGISAVDTRDIAEATAIALIGGSAHYGKTYNLVGPEELSGPKAARIWSEVLKKEVRYAGDDMDAFEARMRQNAPSWSAFDIRMMFQGYLERGFAAIPDDLAALGRLLGREPRTYQEFARETAEAWARPEANRG